MVSREYPPDSGWGGIASYTYQHAHALKELGHDVEVIALSADGASVDNASKKIEDGILVRRVRAANSLTNMEMMQASTPFTHFVLRSVLALSKAILAEHSENPFDVAEVPEHLAEGLCPAMSKLLPLVVRLHTPQSKFIAEKYHNITSSFDQEFVAMIERIAMLSADVITSPSEDMADYVAGDLNYPRQEIKIIRNPVSIEKFNPSGSRALADDGRLNVLFVGRLEERKGVHFLIRAVPKIVAAYPKVHFVIVGADTNNAHGQRSTLHELQSLVSEHGCGSNVSFIPHVPLAQMPDYYRSADICVVPSLYDNAPCTVLEGMSSGKPVVTTSAGGSKEYVVHGESGLVVAPGDAEALAEAIKEILLDQSKRDTMGKSARARILDKFDPLQLAAETVEIYKQAMQKYSARHYVGVYQRPAERFMADTENLLASYERMLYDFLYLKSWSFRLKHRLRRLSAKLFGSSQPKL